MVSRSHLFSGALSISVGASLLMSTQAHAQETDNSLMSDIVVTARKRDETAQSVPVAISAFNGAQLQALGVTESKDLGKFTPGLQWKSDSPFAGNVIFVRGVGNNTTLFTGSPAVAVYLDESYLNSQAFHGFSTFDVDRVEVLKGPQGTLYGRNTTGGAIKYITKQPDLNKDLTGEVNVNLGNFGLRKVDGGIGAALSDKVAVRIGFVSHDRGGIYDDYARDTKTTDVNVKAIRVQLLMKPTEEFSVLLGGTYARARSDDVRFKRVDTVDPATISFGPGGPGFSGRCANPGVGTAPGCTSILQLLGVPDDLNRDAFQVQSNLSKRESLERVNSWGTWLTMNYDFGAATLTSATSYYHLNHQGPQDVDATAFNVAAIFDEGRPRQFSQEVRLTSDGSGDFRWVLGGYYFHESITQLKPVNLAAIGIGFGSAGKQKTAAIAAFAEGSYRLDDALDLTVGLRWSRDKRDVDFSYFTFASDGRENYRYRDVVAQGFGPGSFTLNDQSKAWSNLSGRVTLSYKIDEQVMVYASANRGYKGGEFNFGSDTPATAGFVDPETVDAFELGIKSQWFDRRLRFNAAAFYYRYKDKQETLFDTGTATLSNADARVKGMEVELTAVPVQGLTLNAGLSLLDAKYTDFPACQPNGAACDGNRLSDSPKSTLNLLAKYDFDLGGRTASIQGSGNWTAQRYFDFRNVNYISDDGYWLFDARASYELMDNLTASLWVQNIANTRYYTNGFDVSAFGYSLLLPGTPRSYGGSISYRF